MPKRPRVLNAQAHKLPEQSRLLRLMKFWRETDATFDQITYDTEKEFGRGRTYNSVFQDCMEQDNRVGDCYLRVYQTDTGFLVCIKGEWFEMNDRSDQPNGLNMSSDDWTDKQLKAQDAERLSLWDVYNLHRHLVESIFLRMHQVEEQR